MRPNSSIHGMGTPKARDASPWTSTSKAVKTANQPMIGPSFEGVSRPAHGSSPIRARNLRQ